MKEVTNIKQLEELVNRTFREIGERHDVDPKLVGEIIADYSELMSGKLEKIIVISEN